MNAKNFIKLVSPSIDSYLIKGRLKYRVVKLSIGTGLKNAKRETRNAKL